MIKRRRKLLTRFAPLLLASLAASLWQFGPGQAVHSVASLSDPAKLSTLGKRGANSRLNKIVYWLEHAEARGLSPENTIRFAQMLNGTREPRASLVKVSLLRNLKIATELGLRTPDNLARLRRGNSALVTRNRYSGEPAEVDHIVPVSLAPETGNELANLEMLPMTLNRRKSDNVGQRQLALARKLFDAGLLTRESLERVQSKAGG